MSQGWIRGCWVAAGLAAFGPIAFADAAASMAPQISLAEGNLAGSRAVEALGANIEAVAARYHRSAEAFREMLLADHRLRLDRQGRLYAVDDLDAPLPARVEPAAIDADAGPQGAPVDQTFLLHSRSTAKRTIYLNFKGAVITDSAWNGGGGAISAMPYDIDGHPDSFSNAELTRIQHIWQRVSEDFAPFDVDVTTEEPLPGRIFRREAADTIYGTSVVITNHNGVYDCSCGGIAYVGVFDEIGSNYYKPALVFWDMLASGDEKYVAEAISHETGHNLGLSHDGYAGGAYYAGHGSGNTGWAPIMGVGYYEPVVQWSRGEYDTANNQENDLVVMQGYGAPLRPDDHGDTMATATPLTATPNGSYTKLSGAGVIGWRTDKDYFVFQANAGHATISVSPAPRAPNLDVELRVLNSAGSQLARVNDPDLLEAKITLDLPRRGTYYLVIDGVGAYSPKDTGYSDYGSLGQYSVSATVISP